MCIRDRDRKDGSTLAKLLDRLCELDFHWIRLHYLYPEAVTDELIETIARQPKILHYLDIPIQHCNDAILKAMRRRNTRVETVSYTHLDVYKRQPLLFRP